jgi:four helix bundle protein
MKPEARLSLSGRRDDPSSVPSNIAEGASRSSKKEFVHFLYIASGSAAELETQVLIGERVGYFQDISNICGKIISIRKMLNALISSVKRAY